MENERDAIFMLWRAELLAMITTCHENDRMNIASDHLTELYRELADHTDPLAIRMRAFIQLFHIDNALLTIH